MDASVKTKKYRRLAQPLLRDRGELRTASWEEALDRAAQKSLRVAEASLLDPYLSKALLERSNARVVGFAQPLEQRLQELSGAMRVASRQQELCRRPSQQDIERYLDVNAP